jgi:hypothetical protein
MPDATTTGTALIIPDETKLRLFPNPVLDILFIETAKRIQRIEILNSGGFLTLSRDFPGLYSVSVEVSQLAAGFYIARVTLEGGNTTSCTFIVER